MSELMMQNEAPMDADYDVVREAESILGATAFEGMVDEPAGGSELAPEMTQTTWDHASKSTDSSDTGSGYTL